MFLKLHIMKNRQKCLYLIIIVIGSYEFYNSISNGIQIPNSIIWFDGGNKSLGSGRGVACGVNGGHDQSTVITFHCNLVCGW